MAQKKDENFFPNFKPEFLKFRERRMKLHFPVFTKNDPFDSFPKNTKRVFSKFNVQISIFRNRYETTDLGFFACFWTEIKISENHDLISNLREKQSEKKAQENSSENQRTA